jgi:hypothetical protein
MSNGKIAYMLDCETCFIGTASSVIKFKRLRDPRLLKEVGDLTRRNLIVWIMNYLCLPMIFVVSVGWAVPTRSGFWWTLPTLPVFQYSNMIPLCLLTRRNLIVWIMNYLYLQMIFVENHREYE